MRKGSLIPDDEMEESLDEETNPTAAYEDKSETDASQI